MRITPQNIESINKDEIFVFGSNLSGMHGAGAAKAALNFGAVYGKAAGLQGNTYAIPTVGVFARNPLHISVVKKMVEEFTIVALEHPYLTFFVTEIGCGLAGFKVEDIAPMFKDCKFLPNVYLPESFWNYPELSGNDVDTYLVYDRLEPELLVTIINGLGISFDTQKLFLNDNKMFFHIKQ